MHPIAHISTSKPYGIESTNSGARYLIINDLHIKKKKNQRVAT